MGRGKFKVFLSNSVLNSPPSTKPNHTVTWPSSYDPHLQGHLVELGHGEDGFLYYIHVFIPQEHVEVGNQF